MMKQSSGEVLKIAQFTFDVDGRSNSGTARVARELVTALSLHTSIRQTLIHFEHFDDPIYKLPNVNEIVVPSLHLPLARRFFSFLLFSVKWRVKRKPRFDIVHWHSSRIPPLFFVFPARRFVVTLHDMNQLLIPFTETTASRVFRLALRLSKSRIDLILGDSKHASKNIIKLGHFPERKVRTMYLGCNFDSLNPKRPEGFIDKKNFILVISRWQEFKNVQRVIEAFESLSKSRLDAPKLVLVGKPVEGFSLPSNLVASSNFRHRIDVLQDLSDEELAFLYDRALVNVVPSLYEGFGLSVLEAMKRGRFSICHNGTATSEIVDDAGIAIDMRDTNALVKALDSVIDNPSLVQALNQASRVRAKSFTWASTSEFLEQQYREILT